MVAMGSMDSMEGVAAEITACRACPRLVAWREQVAQEKRASFRDEVYWGRAVPGFGDLAARVLVLGLAPAAHGANRTGRVFTGDRSGDWLFGAMYRAGFANQPNSTDRNDGLMMRGAFVTAAVRCAPPANAPTREERNACLPYFVRELSLLKSVTVIVTLGAFAYEALWSMLRADGVALPRPRPKFAHGIEVVTDRATIIGCFHPSQQNTFTGKLTEPMIDAIFARARELSD